jgi:hypothetical protein
MDFTLTSVSGDIGTVLRLRALFARAHGDDTG